MCFFMTFLGGVGLGILLAAILTAAKRADEWSEVYHQGVEVGKEFERRRREDEIPADVQDIIDNSRDMHRWLKGED